MTYNQQCQQYIHTTMSQAETILWHLYVSTFEVYCHSCRTTFGYGINDKTFFLLAFSFFPFITQEDGGSFSAKCHAARKSHHDPFITLLCMNLKGSFLPLLKAGNFRGSHIFHSLIRSLTLPLGANFLCQCVFMLLLLSSRKFPELLCHISH